MRKAKAISARAEELRAMLAAYRRMTVEEVEESGWGDLEVELESELWRLEQDLAETGRGRWQAA